MTDYRKRLEDALTAGDRWFAGHVRVEDLRQLLAEGDRTRKLVEALISLDENTPGGLKDGLRVDGGAYQSRYLTRILDQLGLREALDASRDKE